MQRQAEADPLVSEVDWPKTEKVKLRKVAAIAQGQESVLAVHHLPLRRSVLLKAAGAVDAKVEGPE